MFWLILFILGLLILILSAIFNNDEFGLFGGGVLIVSFLIILIPFFNGITDYPALKKQYVAIEAYRNRIKDIKESYYQLENKATLVTGNVENLQQSTNLSKYISDLANKEAEYFSYLEKCKIYKESGILWFFTDGWFISDKIYELPTN
jgi:hypothetical protein